MHVRKRYMLYIFVCFKNIFSVIQFIHITHAFASTVISLVETYAGHSAHVLTSEVQITYMCRKIAQPDFFNRK